MSFEKFEIMGCPCEALSERKAISRILSVITKKECGYSVAINAEKIQRFQNDEELRAIINNSILPYPDGAGAVLGLKWLHGVSSEKVNMPVKVLEAANQYRFKTFIVGADEKNHDLAIGAIVKKYPNLDLVGNLHGFNSKDRIFEHVLLKRPQLIMIAMGSPRQEKLAAELIAICKFGFVVGCGGALDILSGEVRRAPSFMITYHLEWLFRLVQQPYRIRRQLFLPVFLARLIYHSIKKSL